MTARTYRPAPVSGVAASTGAGRLRAALAGPGLAAIAEVKRRSPSAGDIRPDADPRRLASSYETAGAAAVSILVDPRFGGSVHDLRAARSGTYLPLLAKGFFRSVEELTELRRAGADAVLLILRDLDDHTARRMQEAARDLGMDALVEAHDQTELLQAVELGADPIGINARDLSTFQIDRARQLRLVRQAPSDRVTVAESGIEHRAHAIAAELAGADAVLIGSALMRSQDPGARLRELMARPVVKVCGLTRPEDVDAAARAGADMAGFVLADSPRRVDAPLPVPDSLLPVSVVVGRAFSTTGPGLIQRYGEENGHRGRNGILEEEGVELARVLDLPWGEQDPFHWQRAARASGRVVLAGGLGPANVGAAIATVDPWGVDASRSLESAPGIKSEERMRALVEAVRIASEATP